MYASSAQKGPNNFGDDSMTKNIFLVVHQSSYELRPTPKDDQHLITWTPQVKYAQVRCQMCYLHEVL